MLSKNRAQFIRSLHQKKFRQEHGLFLVEGAKSVREVLASDFRVDTLLATEAFYKENALPADRQPPSVEIVSPEELTRVGTLESNNMALALVRTRENRPLLAEPGEIVLLLDDVRDPGNLGTILRIADWYGVRKVVCSDTTAEVYNPKVISASKGSFTRVHWYYTDLVAYAKALPAGTPVYGAFLDGQNVHSLPFGTDGGYLMMGNEANGIRPELVPMVSRSVTIPRYGDAESLNVGIATAVILDNWRRGAA
ncbi:TrmH family RNA methyltransferase [Rudanella lutea]|uniref:TrmH family RNA methyltransferase n=1 Tax=Rudanella lutea TaxID=451374 RepID=UPI00035F40BC|nr:RNA methyltransferase [Rudanella lutea]